jgi:hypothetical protein
MTTKTPIRTVYDAQNVAIGLAEFQTGEFLAISVGGTGGNTVASAKVALSIDDSNVRKLISVTGGGSYDNTTGVINISATDLTPLATKANTLSQFASTTSAPSEERFCDTEVITPSLMSTSFVDPSAKTPPLSRIAPNECVI